MKLHNYNLGDRITVKSFGSRRTGTVKRVTDKRVYLLLDSTTTGNLSAYSLRKVDGVSNHCTFVRVGWSYWDADFGGYFFNNI